ALDVPSETKAWGEMSPLCIDARSRRKTRITRVVEAGRRVGENACFDTLEKPVVVEIINRTGNRTLIRNLLREERFPTQTGIRRQVRADFPVVGHVKVERRFVNLQFVGCALLESKDPAEHKVAHSQSRG